MCGILGFNWRDEVLAKKIGSSLSHRGPDQEGYFSDKNLTLGHRRLSILDLSEKGRQPMSDKSKNYYITFNGEIFNYQEIKEELLEKGYKFKSKTDTEVLLYGYIEFGEKILNKLNGQFAFCIYDKKKNNLFLARDRIGINPLYYYFKDGKFIFGSEMKVIMEAGIEKEIDKFSLNYYFLYGYTPTKRSILKNVFKLEKGHYLKFDLNKNKITSYKRYWDYTLENKITDEKKAKKLILEKLDESVKKRLMADVPVGAFLSGGVDSSAVVALMSKYTKNLNTFSVKFDYQDFDESKYADIISKKFNTKHHVIKFTSKDVKELIPKLVYYYDEPFGDSSMIPTFLVSKVAREKVTVSLSGDGGDELFGGYNSYKHYKLLNVQKFYPQFVNKIGYKVLKNSSNEKLEKLKAFFEIGSLDRGKKFARLMSYLDKDEVYKIIGEDPQKYYREYAKEFYKSGYIDEAVNIDLSNYITEDILTKVDRASLANSLESRPPILDHEMIELACKIDPKLKIKNGEGKYIFKKALEGTLPKQILYRQKKGFGVPLKHYFRNELRDMVEEYVIDYKNPYIGKDIIKDIKVNLDKKVWAKDYSRIIWSILIFNMWYERWIK
jgi:asparagine synthase (glutamine-hydrolysing)